MKPYHPDSSAAARIQDYLDGALSPAEERAFEARLATSPEFRAEVEGWRALYDSLGALPRLAPAPGFAERVLAALPARAPLGVRVWRWVTGGRSASETWAHPPEERLQDFAEGILALPLAARVEAHIGDCPRCASSVTAWRELLGSLEALPRLGPSEGFAERVLAALPAGQAEVLPMAARSASPSRSHRASALDRLAARVRALAPRSRRGWALVATVAAAPAALATAVVWYIMTHPLLTPGHLASFALWRTGDRLAALQAVVSGWLLESAGTFRAFALVEAALASPGLIAGGVLAFCLATVASLWVLWRFLLSSPEEGRYAHAAA